MQKQLDKNLNEKLQSKYPHLELAVLPLSQVNKDNESKRIDSEYFKKEYLENEKIVNSQIRICDFVESKIKNIKSLKLNKDFNYLQISDIDTNKGLEYTTTQTDFVQIPDRATYILHNNDICVSTVRPNRNAVALIKDSKRLVGTSGFCVLRAKDKEILPEVLYTFCKTKFFITKMMRANTASLYPAVIDSDILKCQIPQFPKDFQLEIEKLVKDSHKALEVSKSLYKEAESLLYESLGLDSKNPLESLQKDTHPLTPSAEGGGMKELQSAKEGEQKGVSKSPLPCGGDLGVGSTRNENILDCHDSTLRAESRNDEDTPSLAEGARGWVEKYPHLNISIRALSQSYGKSGRLDSEYYQSKYDFMENKIKSKGFKTLQEICSLINYGSVPTSPYTENGDGVPYIKGLNLKNLEINEDKLDKIKNVENLDSKFFTKENDIIISQMGTVGDCGVVNKAQENYIFASFTIRVRLKNTQEFNPYFVALYIQNIAKEWYLLRNIAQASVRQNTDLPTIRNLYVPKIDSTTQEQIASKIQKSFALRKVAKDLLESAKSKVENKIEGKQ